MGDTDPMEEYRTRAALRMGIPEAYTEARSDDAYRLAHEMQAHRLTGAYICGEMGTGKTWLAAAVAMAYWRATKSRVVFTGTASMLAAMRAEYDGQAAPGPGMAERCTGAALLVLDDMDKARPTDWAREQLYAIVDGRHAAGLPTVATANRTLAELAALWGGDVTAQATCDRLRDGAELVRLDGKSRRGWARK